MTTAARIGATSYSTPTDRQIVVTRVFNAPRALVFDAWTNPKHLPNWMTGPDGWTMSICEIDLRPGGSWRYVWHKSDGSELSMAGSYREVVRAERVVTTESWGPEWPETVNSLDFTESNGQTTVTTTITYPSQKARDAALETGMKEGMDQGFDRLDALLATMV
jgi:uncharacterized protein YndB with AHSA1/START domain